MDKPKREMSLIELINSLPETHIARKEYTKFLGRLSKEKNERSQLEQEVKELKAKLERDRLIHVGYTNGSQLCHAKAENGGEGAFYSDTEGNCFIPLYMLACHLHRLDGTLSEPWANEQLQAQE